MSPDLHYLLLSTILCFVQVLIAATGTNTQVSLPKLAGNRDNMPEIVGWPGRARRAHLNMLENMVVFATLVLIAAVAGKANATTAMGAMIFFWARLAYAADLSDRHSVAAHARLVRERDRHGDDRLGASAGDVSRLLLVHGRLRAHRLDSQFDVDAAGLLEHQGQRHLGVLGERRLQAHEHDVKAAGLELDGGARRDLDALFEPRACA